MASCEVTLRALKVVPKMQFNVYGIEIYSIEFRHSPLPGESVGITGLVETTSSHLIYQVHIVYWTGESILEF